MPHNPSLLIRRHYGKPRFAVCFGRTRKVTKRTAEFFTAKNLCCALFFTRTAKTLWLASMTTHSKIKVLMAGRQKQCGHVFVVCLPIQRMTKTPVFVVRFS